MREIKFRAYVPEDGKMHPDVFDINGCEAWFNSPYVKMMQCTGLKDKNGRDIYEGDIVNTNPNEEGSLWSQTVAWDDASSGFDPFHNVGDGWGQIHADRCEVIGNIYENPGLAS